MFPLQLTDRLLLQPIKPEDQAFVFAGLSHPEVILFYGVRYATFEAAGTQMDWYAALETTGSGLAWKMVEKASGQAAGVICFYHFKPEHKRAEIGFWLLPAFWKKGFASEALRPVIDYCGKEKGIHRLEAFVESGNNASSRLLQKAGFSLEGTMQDCEIKEGRFISLHIYALILPSQQTLQQAGIAAQSIRFLTKR